MITIPDATECPKIQQWTAPENFLCGVNTGLGCELSKHKDGLPLEVTFYNDDDNSTKFAPCSAFNSANFLVPMTDTGAVTKKMLGANCIGTTGEKVKVSIKSPCHQKKSSFEYGVENDEVVVECGSPSSNGETMHIKVAADFYKYGVDLGAHVRAVLNVHSATCEFTSDPEGTMEVSESGRIGSVSNMMLLMGVIGCVGMMLGA